MSKIRIVNGPYRGREKTLVDKAMTIGRDAEAGVQILDRSASRFHAEVFPVGGMWFVRDLDSKNGTYVNDEKIGDEELLREGDVIKIGSTQLAYESGAALSDDDSSGRIAYRDDPDLLSNTLEFRLDELSDIAEPQEQDAGRDHARSLRMLYQMGRILSDGPHTLDKEIKVLDFLVTSMPAESALIFRRDAVSGKLVPTVVRTSGPGVQPIISRSIIKKTFSENKALHTANAQDDDRFEKNQSVIAKGIRSVLCVPLTVGGATKGVLYLSRGENAAAFDQIDLELVSAVAIQLGMAQNATEQTRRHREALWQMTAGMVKALESRAGLVGAGERCARYCVAIAVAMGLDGDSRDRIGHAGLLHHFARLTGDGKPTQALALFDGIDDLDGVLGLLRAVQPGARSDDDHDTEARILAVASAFETRSTADPGRGPQQVIEAMMGDGEFDSAVAGVLHSCHLDGSLYNARVG